MGADRSEQYVRATITVGKEDAEKVRALFIDRGAFDPERSVSRDEKVHFPASLDGPEGLNELRAALEGLGIRYDIELMQGAAAPNRQPIDPFQRAKHELLGEIPGDLVHHLPDRWEKIGDAVVIALDNELLDWKREIALVYGRELRARYVLLDRGGIKGELREPSMEVLLEPPDGNYRTRHRENGVFFDLDPRTIMFSSGNVDERMRAPLSVMEGPRTPREAVCREEGKTFDGEIVLDMFAGIGYFSLPIAVHAKVRRVVAVEKNPKAFGFLRDNIRLNDQEQRMVAILGDNRTSLPSGIADRVLMGYVGGTLKFVRNAVHYLRLEGGIVHFHDTIPVEMGLRGLFMQIAEAVASEGLRSEVLSARKVKSYAPRIVHAAVDLLVLPK